MSEITPNTPNPVREDAYVEELSEKLGIDPQYIPKSPVWRNEEEIKAIAEMFANMSGGGSGGGVLVVNFTSSRDGWTCDKTYSEMVTAITGGQPVVACFGGGSFAFVRYNSILSVCETFGEYIADGDLHITQLVVDSSDSVTDAEYSISLGG